MGLITCNEMRSKIHENGRELTCINYLLTAQGRHTFSSVYSLSTEAMTLSPRSTTDRIACITLYT